MCLCFADVPEDCAEHDNCVALVFARTDTQAFQKWVWPFAKSLFFISGRLSFCHVSGDPGGTAGAPSVLIAYGDVADQRLRANQTVAGQYLKNLPSKLIRLRLKKSKIETPSNINSL